jgi:hypothetical protein
VTSLLLRIIVDAAPKGRRRPRTRRPRTPRRQGTALSPIRSCLPPGILETLIQRGLMVWTSLFGVISFELNGQPPQAAGRNPVTVTPSSPECVRHRISFMATG